MTELKHPEPPDWLNEVLDKHPAEPVPPGFKIRLMSRIQGRSASRTRLPGLRLPLLLAAALMILATGYWMGMGAPQLSTPSPIRIEGDLASLDLEELYENRNLLEAWELLQDPELELGFGESVAGVWDYGAESASLEQPR
jgi:hypothetical protein